MIHSAIAKSQTSNSFVVEVAIIYMTVTPEDFMLKIAKQNKIIQVK